MHLKEALILKLEDTRNVVSPWPGQFYASIFYAYTQTSNLLQ
jgi:hypothetical protein